MKRDLDPPLPPSRKIKPFLLENDSEKYSSSLSRQSSETKPSTKLVLVRQEALLYLEFTNLSRIYNKQNVSDINLFKKSTFPSLKISVDTLIDGQE